MEITFTLSATEFQILHAKLPKIGDKITICDVTLTRVSDDSYDDSGNYFDINIDDGDDNKARVSFYMGEYKMKPKSGNAIMAAEVIRHVISSSQLE